MTEKEAVCHLVGTLIALKMILKREMTQKDNDAIGMLAAMAAAASAEEIDKELGKAIRGDED